MKDLIEKYVGKRALIADGRMHGFQGLQYEVLIKDVKVTWNRERFLVTPVAGRGECYVENLTLIE